MIGRLKIKYFKHPMSSLSSLWPILYEVEAICDYSSGHPQDLVFERGDSIVIRGVESDDWFNGTNLRSLRFGSFPKSKIRIIQQYEQQKKSRSVSATVENVSTTPPPLPSRNSTTPLPLPPRSVASARLADESPPTSVIGRLENHRRQVETVNLTGVLRGKYISWRSMRGYDSTSV